MRPYLWARTYGPEHMVPFKCVVPAAFPTDSQGPPVKQQKQHTVIDSPYGLLTLVADDGVLCGLYMTEQRHRPPQESFGARDDTLFAACRSVKEAEALATKLRDLT